MPSRTGRPGTIGAMDSPELIRRAEARGVATSYRASQGREVEVAAETIEAVLAALGDPPATSRCPPRGAPGARTRPLPPRSRGWERARARGLFRPHHPTPRRGPGAAGEHVA